MRRLLLDFGGVVIKTPFELLHRIGSPGWTGPFDPTGDDLWREMQTGGITERHYWHTRASQAFPEDEDPVTVLMDRLFAPPSDEVVRPQIRTLIDETAPAVLTNDLARFHPPEWLERMELAGSFEPLIDLSFTGFLKPSEDAYRHALEVLGSPADEVVFVDDQPLNITGATRFGLRTVWFDVTDPGGSVSRIREAIR
ncbi:MAG: HAD-IA family hydrolase [Acidimicrobiia bacterium]|nr:HAD-IA family hydrolase [Acidimicrobiia bacterium]MDH4309556.1 HAD-IA family hydrolase [Acidimicrobiia bacterium]MDH5293257.1 HAD-IA family hydrolase [Acidimicrobiia bacterium]